MRIMAAAAALLLLLVSLAAAATSNTSYSYGCETPYRERSEEETRQILEDWKTEHGETYSSAAEEERRYAIFKDGLRHAHWQWHKNGCPQARPCNTERSEEETRRIFMEWSAEHGKTYNSDTEVERIYAMFRDRLCEVDRWWHDRGYPAWSWDRERSEEEARRIFVAWKAESHKAYSSISHEKRRYAMFRDHLRNVDRTNAGYAIGVIHSGRIGINQFSDLTQEEYLATCCGYWPHDKPMSPAESKRIGEIQERLRLEHAPYSM